LPCDYCKLLPLNGKKYCQDCGFPTIDNQLTCSSCRNELKYAEVSIKPKIEETHYYNSVSQQQNIKQSEDIPNTGANIAACCSLAFTGGLPIVGLILYFVWKDEKPNAAKSVCMWSLFPFITLVIIYLIFIVFGGLMSFLI